MPTNFCRRRWSTASLLATIFICFNSPAAQTYRTSENVTVVIDAGHGGHDRGGIPGQRIAEKDMTLDVAQRLRNVLAASGYRVVMTRDSDVFVPLGTRVAMANSYRNAIFVCIHFNATGRSGASGLETYFYSRDNLPLASAIHDYVTGGAPSANRALRSASSRYLWAWSGRRGADEPGRGRPRAGSRKVFFHTGEMHCLRRKGTQRRRCPGCSGPFTTTGVGN